MCFDFLYNFYLKYFYSKKNCARYCHKCENDFMESIVIFSSGFNETCIFSTDFQKKARISSFIRIRPVGAELSHPNRQTDGRTNGHEANNRFSEVCERA